MTDDAEALRLRRRIESKLRRDVSDNGLLAGEGRLLLAVSGGPDSTALLLLLLELTKRQPGRIAVAHFDHALRGAATSKREAAFVRELAQSRGVPFYSGRGDVGARAKTDRISIEEAARRERYEFLARAAREAGCEAVATGHTASDQAETVLLHVLRGAGLRGLAAMSPRASWPFAGHDGLSLLRPLLCLTSAETRAYCDAAGVTPIEDESNASMAHRRNRLRHELLPALRAYNPRVDEALVRLAAAARDELSFVEDAAASAIETTGDGVALPRALLAGWPAAPRHHALRRAYAAVAGDGRDLGERHVAALDRLLRRGRTGDAVDLPRKVHARLGRDVLTLRLGQEGGFVLPEASLTLAVPGEARFGPYVVVASREATPPGATVDAEALGATICVRRRRPGDRFQPLGMSETKKLQDFFVDARVDRDQRDGVPLFETPRGIIAVGDLRIAEWAKPRPSRVTLTISYRLA